MRVFRYGLLAILLVLAAALAGSPADAQTQPAPAKPAAKPRPKPAAAPVPTPSPAKPPAVVAGGAKPTLCGHFGDGGAYPAAPGGKKICFAIAKPSASETTPPGRPRNPAYMF